MSNLILLSLLFVNLFYTSTFQAAILDGCQSNSIYPNSGDIVICDSCLGCNINCNADNQCNNITVNSSAFRTIINCNGINSCQGSIFNFQTSNVPESECNRINIECNADGACMDTQFDVQHNCLQGMIIDGGLFSNYDNNLKNANILCRFHGDNQTCTLNCGDCEDTVFTCEGDSTCICNGNCDTVSINGTNISPTLNPSESPIYSTNNPTYLTSIPTNYPTQEPTIMPSIITSIPTKTPTQIITTETPLDIPNNITTKTPTESPTETPTIAPSIEPTISQMLHVSKPPTNNPNMPTPYLTEIIPSIQPTKVPIKITPINSTLLPTMSPTPSSSLINITSYTYHHSIFFWVSLCLILISISILCGIAIYLISKKRLKLSEKELAIQQPKTRTTTISNDSNESKDEIIIMDNGINVVMSSEGTDIDIILSSEGIQSMDDDHDDMESMYGSGSDNDGITSNGTTTDRNDV